MTSSKKTPKANAKQGSYGFRRGYWLHFFLGLLAAYSLYVVVMGVASTGYLPLLANLPSLMYAGTSSLLIVLFSALFFFYAARKLTLPTVAKVAAYLLVCFAIVAFVGTFIISNNASVTSSGLNFAFSVLFHGPYGSLFNSVVSIVGIVTLIVKLIQRNR